MNTAVYVGGVCVSAALGSQCTTGASIRWVAAHIAERVQRAAEYAAGAELAPAWQLVARQPEWRVGSDVAQRHLQGGDSGCLSATRRGMPHSVLYGIELYDTVSSSSI